MTKLVIFGILLLVSVCSTQQHYDDPDYQDYQVPAPRVATKPVPRAINRPLDTIQRTTPVPILKQINRHNDDGSYTYGFEAADGTFKIETKYTNGDVKGKYGFVDDTGKVRTVEYGADRYGFQPAGEGITVAPPTLVDESLLEEDLEEQRLSRPRIQQSLRTKAASKPRPPPQYQPQPQFHEQPTYEQQINYEVQESPEPIIPPRSAPVPARPISIPNAAPVPPRLQIPGAVPVAGRQVPPQLHRATIASAAPSPSRPIFANSAPVPPRPQIPGAFQAPDPVRPRQQAPRAGPAHQPAFFQATPAVHHQPVVPVQHQPRVFQAPRAAHGSVLDQLAKDYALPQGSAATINDFSFSSGF